LTLKNFSEISIIKDMGNSEQPLNLRNAPRAISGGNLPALPPRRQPAMTAVLPRRQGRQADMIKGDSNASILCNSILTAIANFYRLKFHGRLRLFHAGGKFVHLRRCQWRDAPHLAFEPFQVNP